MSTTNVTERECSNGHFTSIQSWAVTVPTVCPFPPCGENFLSSQQIAANTRVAKQRAAILREIKDRKQAAYEAAHDMLAKAFGEGIVEWVDDVPVYV